MGIRLKFIRKFLPEATRRKQHSHGQRGFSTAAGRNTISALLLTPGNYIVLPKGSSDFGLITEEWYCGTASGIFKTSSFTRLAHTIVHIYFPTYVSGAVPATSGDLYNDFQIHFKASGTVN